MNFGNFTLVCETCTTQAIGTGSFFSAFTFDLVFTDVTDGATGIFVGTSTGGDVFSDVSQVTINWAPLMLGPGTPYALVGFVLVGFGLAHRRTRSSMSYTRHTGRLANGPSGPARQPTAPRHLTARRHPCSLRHYCLQRFRMAFHLHCYLCRPPLQPGQRTGGKA